MVDEVKLAFLFVGLIGMMYCIWSSFNDKGGGTPCH